MSFCTRCRNLHYGENRTCDKCLAHKREYDQEPINIVRCAWHNIIKRCCDPTLSQWADYGGRGIDISNEFYMSFEKFLAEVGFRPSNDHQIDRIDNNRGYERGNLRWSTLIENRNNTRINRLIAHKGEIHTLAEWARILKVDDKRLRARLSRGMTIEQAITIPLRGRATKLGA